MSQIQTRLRQFLGCVGILLVCYPSSALAEDIIYMGEPPVLIRLHLRVDGKPWETTRHELAKRQFKLIDTDHDGLIEVDQLQGIPLPKFNRQAFEQWDSETKDGKLSEKEFMNLFEQAGQAGFLLAEGTGRASNRVKLFGHLDANNDGKLTESELEKARHSLARLDYDDDETISTAELTPFVNPLVQQAFVGRETPLASDAPFISVADFDSLSDVAVVMLRRYSEQDSSKEVASKEVASSDASSKKESSDEEVPVAELRCAAARLGAEKMVSQFDANRDGQFDHAEMQKLLADRSPDVELDIELTSRVAKRPKMKLKQDRIKASKRRIPSRGSSRIDLMASNTEFNLRAQSSTSQNSDNRNFYLSQMRIADEDKNGYLGADEFPRVGLAGDFNLVDGNGDEMVTRDELSAYLERDAFTNQSQVVLSVSAGSRTLFSVLDNDYDQRLTTREFKGIVEKLKTLDKNRDNTIESNEISQEYRLSFSMGRPRVFQQAMMQQQDPNRSGPRSSTTPNSDAPNWFQNMDRNQDGDLSWREFLGTRKQFDQMDTDGDGLVTVVELE